LADGGHYQLIPANDMFAGVDETLKVCVVLIDAVCCI
jgi:hypothetical protein